MANLSPEEFLQGGGFTVAPPTPLERPSVGGSKFAPLTSEIIGTTAEGRNIFRNEDGTRSSERSITIENPNINGGRATNIPTIFNGIEVGQEEAERIISEAGGVDPETGRRLEGFDSIDAAVAAAEERSPGLKPVEAASTVSQEEFLAGGGFTIGAPDPIAEPEPEVGLMERIGQDIETRGTELDEIRRAVGIGEQTFAEGVGQVVGKTIIGGGLDIVGEIAGSGLDVVASGVSAITPDFLGEPIADFSEGALEWVLGSQIGQLGIEAARAGEQAYEEFKAEHPRAARNIESVMNVGLIMAPAASALRVGSKVPRFTGRALADAPESEELFKQATKKFNSAKQSGSVLNSDDFADFMGNFETAFNKQIDPSLHPRLTGTLNLLEKRLGDDLDAEDLLLVRRNIAEVGSSLSPDERRLGRNLLEGFDDFVENLPGTPDWIEARKLYSQGIKTEMLENAMLKANSTASGLENGLRIEFRKILNNKRESKRFNKTEKAAMEKVVQGDFTTNNLRKIGAFGGGEGLRRTPLTTLAGVAVGAEAGGGVGALAVPTIGRISQGLATNRTLRAANIARAITAGARPVVPTRAGPTVRRGAAALALSGAEGADTPEDLQ